MTFLDGLKGMKGIGGKFLKNMAINMFLEQQHGTIIGGLSMALATMDPTEISDYIYEGKALPIPDSFYPPLFGFEDFLESFEVTTLFEWINEANPLIGAAIMDCGQDGIKYMIELKNFIVNMVKEMDPDYSEPGETTEGAAPTDETISQEMAQTANVTDPEEGEENSPPIPVHTSRIKIVKAEGDEDQPAGTESSKKTTLVKPDASKVAPMLAKCDECGWEEYLPKEKAEALTECPNCGKPA